LQSLDETSVKSGVSLSDLLRRPAVSYAALAQIDPDRPDLPRSVKLNVEVSIK
jgi:tRNA uridine 5-carboxymethylaminomethyl modification enzyme